MRPVKLIEGEIVHALAELFEQDEDEAIAFLRTLRTRAIGPDPFYVWRPEPTPGMEHGFYYARKLGEKRIEPDLIYVDGDDGPETFKVWGAISPARRLEELDGYAFCPIGPYPP